MHYYQFNIGDYASHTVGLSLLEDLAYRRLLDIYYLSEQPLNKCSTSVARSIGFVQHVPEVEYILNRYFVIRGGKWHHDRVDFEINEFKTKLLKRAEAGQASGKSRRKQRDAKNEGTPVEQVFDSVQQNANNVELTNNQEPITNNQEPSLKDVSPKGDMSTPDGDRRPPVPHEKIIELYHEQLPANPRVITKLWNGTRKKHLQTRWNEDKPRQDIGWWRDFFTWVSYSEFLTGRAKQVGDRSPFIADLGWLIKPENFVKVYEGKYHDLNAIARYERDHGGEK